LLIYTWRQCVESISVDLYQRETSLEVND